MRSLMLLALVACGEEQRGICLCWSGDSAADPMTCNPLTQGGCNPGEKCTWINDQDYPTIGHVGCVPDPPAGIAIGSACVDPPPGPMGYDACVEGSVCISGECRQICDPTGGAPTCDQNHICSVYETVFRMGGVAIAGVCDPACDPLTQALAVGTSPAACGSPDETMPTKGCYGYESYSCASVDVTADTLTDRGSPRTEPTGKPYLNGCAPGFVPLFYEMTGSTKTLCAGYCAALEIDNTPANQGNTLGDPNAIGKLPATPARAGDATCAAGKKGSAVGDSHCKFLWPYLVEPMTGPYVDTLGVCQSIGFFKYARDADMVVNDPFPACNTLPRLTTDMTDEDAAVWGCQKLSSSQIGGTPALHPALSDIRVPSGLVLELVRHNLN